MPTEKLTDRRVRAAKAEPGGRLELWDANMPGLGLRVAPETPQGPGTKTWFVRYRVAGAQRRMKLGTYPALSLSAAHDAARDIFKQVSKGEDPAVAKCVEPPAAPETFAAVAEEFITRHVRVKNRPVTAKGAERIIRVELITAWGTKPIESITRRNVIDLLDTIVDRGTPIWANRTLAAARKMFNWCIERDIIKTSPCDRVKPPGNETERQRVLTDEEVRVIWQAAESLGPAFGPIIRMCLLTAQRKGETTAMRWKDLDLEKMVWTIPREVTKGDRAHEVPLSSLALKVLRAQNQLGDFVFPGREPKDNDAQEEPKEKVGKPFNGFSKAKDRIDVKAHELLQREAKERGDDPEKVKPLDPWTIHDLRRTAATGMARLGVPRLVISKIENHVEGGVTKLYDRYAYDAEKRDALDRWAAKVESLINPPPDNVVQFRPEQEAV